MPNYKDNDEEIDINPLVKDTCDQYADEEFTARQLPILEPMEVAAKRSTRNCANRKCICRCTTQAVILLVGAWLVSPIYYWLFDRHVYEGPLGDVCLSFFNVSSDDLIENISKTDNLCFDGEKDKCKCLNTIEPTMPSKPERKQDFINKWKGATRRNHHLAQKYHEGPYDVVLLGDSITEHWIGADLGTYLDHWAPINDVFEAHFNKEAGGMVDGLALGIGGDRCEHLLYRIENGELPDTLKAKVFWILIGTNDMGGVHCSGESIAAGNIRIAEELLQRRPNATIVLNSFLPRGKIPSSWLDSNEYSEAMRVNQWLECYAASTPRVEFFNATDIFLGGENQTELVPEFYSDGVHPSAAGSAKWASAIVDFVRELTS